MATHEIVVKQGKSDGMSGKGAASSSASGMESVKAARQSAIEKEKRLNEKGNDGRKRSDNSRRAFVKSLDNLTKEIRKLDTTIKNKKFGSGIGGGNGGGGNLGMSDVGKGMQSIGTTLPVVGAFLAATGYIASKVAEIGNNYIDKVSEQSRTVGIAGMQRGEGMYLASEMGAGMKSYSMTTGKFLKDDDNRKIDTAIKMGAIYGQSSEESLRVAGIFDRVKGKSERDAVATMVGGGIETQLPTLLSAMADDMEEAVKNGFDASAMSRSIPEAMTQLTMASRTKDVNLALTTARAASGAKANAGKGQIEDMSSFMAWRTGQKKMLEKFQDTGFIDEEIKAGRLDEKHKTAIAAEREKNGGNLTLPGLEKALGGELSNVYTMESVNKLSNIDVQKGAIEQMIKLFDPNGTKSPAELRAAMIMGGASLNVDQGGMMGTEALLNSRNANPNGLLTMAQGISAFNQQYDEVMSSSAGWSVQRGKERENFLFEEARSMAQATMEVERAMRTLASGGISILQGAIDRIKSHNHEETPTQEQRVNQNIRNIHDPAAVHFAPYQGQ